MFVGICKITLRISSVASLKGKRQIIKKVIERSKNWFNISMAEVGSHDEWQRSEIAFSIVGNEGSFVNSVIDKVVDFIEDLNVVEIIDVDVEIINL